jgi:hypothetical protein
MSLNCSEAVPDEEIPGWGYSTVPEEMIAGRLTVTRTERSYLLFLADAVWKLLAEVVPETYAAWTCIKQRGSLMGAFGLRSTSPLGL